MKSKTTSDGLIELEQLCVAKIYCQKDDGWCVFLAEDDEANHVKCVGKLPSLQENMFVNVCGSYSTSQYGRQFDIARGNICATIGQGQVVANFLRHNFKGIGPVRAITIAEKYGDEIFNMFENPKKLQKLLKEEFSGKSAEALQKEWEVAKELKDIYLNLKGATQKQITKIFEKYGKHAKDVLVSNPYQLITDIKGFGFKTVDSLALLNGILPYSEFRISAGITYALDEALNDGHTCLDRVELKKRVVEILTDNEGVKKEIEKCFDKGLEVGIGSGELVEYEKCIYTARTFSTEKTCAEYLKKHIQSRPVRAISDEIIEHAIQRMEVSKREDNPEFEVTEEQSEAVYLALQNNISIISGGAGRGKTTISEICASAFIEAAHGFEEDVVFLAPTGRAAKRITEATGYPAKTIHREVWIRNSQKYKDWLESRPKNKLFVVDEASMIDIFLLKKLLTYTEYCQIIFLGDVNQIASVGAGCVLRDMIDSDTIPYKLLQKSHRNMSTIAVNAQHILDQEKLATFKFDENFTYHVAEKDNLLYTVLSAYFTKCREYGVKDVMLCTPKKSASVTSTSKLNEAIQQALQAENPTECKIGKKTKFYVGDRVMQTKNDYTFAIFDEDDQKVKSGVFNGEKGTVVEFCKREGTPCMKVEFDEGTFGYYEESKLDKQEIILAFATTIHKCQGSEAQCVIVAHTFADYILLNRNLLYTGVTRGIKECHLFGEEEFKWGSVQNPFDIAISRKQDLERNTHLDDMLNDDRILPYEYHG